MEMLGSAIVSISFVVFLWAAVGLVGRGFQTVEQQLLSGFSRLFCSPLAIVCGLILYRTRFLGHTFALRGRA